MKAVIIALFTFILFFGSNPAQAQNGQIIIITNPSLIPPTAKYVGKIRPEFTPKNVCSYDEVMDDLKRKAAKKNANLLLVIECDHLFPTLFPEKACITLLAEGYMITNFDSLKKFVDTVTGSISKDSSAYLFLYRQKGHEYPGAKNKTFNVMLDSANTFPIMQVCNYAIKITPGKHIAKIENSKEEIIFDAIAGRSYYIKAVVDKNTTFVPGQVVFTFGGWSNSIRLINDTRAGKLEYDVIIAPKNTIQ